MKHQNYDWYLKADDDSFIHVDNMRTFLGAKDSNMPVTFGYDFKPLVEKGYHSGGGYVLSRRAFHFLGYELAKQKPICANSGVEDVDVARCLRKLHVYPNKSLDEKERERFHMFSIDDYFRSSLPEWIHAWSSNGVKMVILYSSIKGYIIVINFFKLKKRALNAAVIHL